MARRSITPFVAYMPATQTAGAFFKQVHMWFSPSWVVRSSGPIAGLPSAIRQSVATVDALLPIAKMESMAAVQAASLAQQRFMMSVVVGLGLVALLLAAIGIHGLIASSVSERRRELGIRLALGATGRQVLTDVVMPGIVLAGAGVAIGSVAALAAVRLLQSFLWGVTATDPLTFGLVVVDAARRRPRRQRHPRHARPASRSRAHAARGVGGWRWAVGGLVCRFQFAVTRTPNCEPRTANRCRPQTADRKLPFVPLIVTPPARYGGEMPCIRFRNCRD